MIDRLQALPSRPLPGGLVLLVATTRAQRGRGLARLAPCALPADHALLLPRCRSVHTFGMRFALDLLWLDGEERLVGHHDAVPRGRLRSHLRARAVVEAHAGQGASFARALSELHA